MQITPTSVPRTTTSSPIISVVRIPGIIVFDFFKLIIHIIFNLVGALWGALLFLGIPLVDPLGAKMFISAVAFPVTIMSIGLWAEKGKSTVSHYLNKWWESVKERASF